MPNNEFLIFVSFNMRVEYEILNIICIVTNYWIFNFLKYRRTLKDMGELFHIKRKQLQIGYLDTPKLLN